MQLALVHPLDFQVLEQLPVRHPEPPPFRDADLVCLDLGGRIGVIEAFREKLLPFPELADVDELVHVLEALEVIEESFVMQADVLWNDDVREFHLGSHHRCRTSERIRRASWLWLFGSTVRYADKMVPSGPMM